MEGTDVHAKPRNTADILTHFHSLLTAPSSSSSPDSLPHHPTPNHPHTATLSFTGLVVIPCPTFPTSPIETLSPEVWSQSLTANLTSPIATIQAFLRTLITFNARLVVLTPSITSSLALPFNAIETSTLNAMDGFVASLRSEMDTLGGAVKIAHVKLGNLDLGHVPHSAAEMQQVALSGSRTLLNPGSGEVMGWSSSVREAYARNYMMLQQQKTGAPGRSVRGSPMREVHNAVFDALTLKNPKEVWRVGRGSLVYEMIGKVMPRRIIAWGLGLRRLERGL